VSDTIDRLTAALADRYRIERELGQGGMATVYLAHDVRHDRKVAVKVLRPELAAVIGAERFLSEIKTTANLQHPHILPLFDSGIVTLGLRMEDGGQRVEETPSTLGAPSSVLFYVMPFIDGVSLRDRITREHQLPVNDAMRIATEVASALDYAHRHGVIHRDIKPENILLHDGRALVADFGIALAVSTAGTRMTETGMSLGTPHYMSPEQAMGEREITARSDVYALGCITYEMLVGEPPFTGPTAQAIIARVMTEEPRALTGQRKSIPDELEAAVFTALEKLPADRFATAAEFANALTGHGPATTHHPRTSARRAHQRDARPLFLATAAIAALALIAAVWGWLRPTDDNSVNRQRVVLWRHGQGDFLSPGLLQVSSQAAIAPDGSSVVFSDSVGGTTQLFIKLRDASEPVAIPGTENALSPFFSPDGSWIGFFQVDGSLRKIPTAGGGAVKLAQGNTETYYAAVWLDDESIIYTGGFGGLHRISASGGPTTVVVHDSVSRNNLALIQPLPGSRGVLVTICAGNCANGSAVGVVDFGTDSIRQLVDNAAGAWYAPSGHLLYTDRAGGLYAAGFDLDRMELTTGAVPILENVSPTQFALSPSGTVIYSLSGGAGASAELHWVSRDGSSTPVDTSWKGEFEYPAISPDGNSIAVSVRDRTTDLWIRRADGARLKLTNAGTLNWRPFWMADGRSLVFVSNVRGGAGQDDTDLYVVPADASSPPVLLHRHIFGLWEGEVSQDGSWLVIRSDEAESQINIRARRMSGDTALIPIVVGGTNIQFSLSPDGRSLAYLSNATGQREVYVMPFPGGGTSQMVSRGGGTEPRWSRSGRELFFKSGGQLMSVAVTPGPVPAFGTPRPLFGVAGYRGARNRQQYDVAPGDQRFLMIRNLESEVSREAVYVENWFTELKAKLKSQQ
jgi:serine/threonine protein kinase